MAEEIKARHAALVALVNEKKGPDNVDCATKADFLHPEIKVMAPFHETACGPEAVEKLKKELRGFMGDVERIENCTEEVEAGDHCGFERGSCCLKLKDGGEMKAKYLWIWKKVDGKWKVYCEMMNPTTVRAGMFDFLKKMQEVAKSGAVGLK